MFSMILGGWAGAPSISHLPAKIMEIIMFSMILGAGRGPPSPPSSRKNYGNHSVFNDFAGGMGSSRHLLSRKKTIGINKFSMI